MEMPMKQLSLRTLLLWWVMYLIKITIFHMVIITNIFNWCFDIGAMLHVCNYKAQFKTYEKSSIELKVLVGIHSKEKVHGKCIVKVKLSFGKKFSWPMIFIYLISRKANFLFKNSLVQEWDISRQCICYYLSVIYQYVLVVLILLIFYLLHARLRLLNFKFLKLMSKHDIIYISMMICVVWCIN